MDGVMDEILVDIKSFMTDTSFNEVFYKAILQRLGSFGYDLKRADAWMISFCIHKVEDHIKNSCNILSVPHGLYTVAIDMICGEFLLSLKQTGKLNIDDLDLSGVITQLKEGDTAVHFAEGSSDDEKLTGFINYLLTKGVGDLVCYRKIKW